MSRDISITNTGVQGDTLPLLGAFPSKNLYLEGIKLHFVKYLVGNDGVHNNIIIMPWSGGIAYYYHAIPYWQYCNLYMLCMHMY